MLCLLRINLSKVNDKKEKHGLNMLLVGSQRSTRNIDTYVLFIVLNPHSHFSFGTNGLRFTPVGLIVTVSQIHRAVLLLIFHDTSPAPTLIVQYTFGSAACSMPFSCFFLHHSCCILRKLHHVQSKIMQLHIPRKRCRTKGHLASWCVWCLVYESETSKESNLFMSDQCAVIFWWHFLPLNSSGCSILAFFLEPKLLPLLMLLERALALLALPFELRRLLSKCSNK